MASAVDSRLAYARLSAVATASRLPTATRGSNNSYTTSWDTTQARTGVALAGRTVKPAGRRIRRYRIIGAKVQSGMLYRRESGTMVEMNSRISWTSGSRHVGDEIAGERLCGEERGARDPDFRLGRRPFTAVERFDRELDDELVGRNTTVFGLLFERSPLRGRHPDVLLQRLCHSSFRSFGAIFGTVAARIPLETSDFQATTAPKRPA